MANIPTNKTLQYADDLAYAIRDFKSAQNSTFDISKFIKAVNDLPKNDIENICLVLPRDVINKIIECIATNISNMKDPDSCFNLLLHLIRSNANEFINSNNFQKSVECLKNQIPKYVNSISKRVNNNLSALEVIKSKLKCLN